MKKYLPKILIVLLVTCHLSLVTISPVFAQTPATGSGTTLSTDDPASKVIDPDSGWQPDAEVTFTGQLAARSQDTLNWLLRNYQWQTVDSRGDPLAPLWQFVVSIVATLIALFILAAAFLMIVTRGRSITVRRFIPRFIFIIILIVLSYTIVKTIYQLTDGIQAFFINIHPGQDPPTIQTPDLLNVAFNYTDFRGFRKVGDLFIESQTISLLLIKLTAATYYTMFIILIIRKIILWFFILVSPVFPLLLFFKPLRNTAKIWVGEMFRWVLYAPLFAIFLRGLVTIWKNYIPLGFSNLTAIDPLVDKNFYPTTINILLGGPKIVVAGNNNINRPDTFILYVVALLMLWMVIIMPWILLRIFLDYFNEATSGENNLLKYLAGPNSPLSPLINRGRNPSGTPPGTPPSGSGLAGMAKSLPNVRFKHSPVEVQNAIQATVAEQNAQQNLAINQMGQSVSQAAQQGMSAASSNLGSMIASRGAQFTNIQTEQAAIEVLGEANLTLPTMRDIAKYETAQLSGNQQSSAEMNKITEALSRLAGTSKLTTPAEQQRFSAIKERIVQQAKQGNSVAKTVSNAVAPGGGALPESNEVQQVNLDDYEEIRNTWIQNYRTLDPPTSPDGSPLTRSEWLKSEVAKIPQVIDLLLSDNPEEVEKGKQMVSNILPFLLLGGFSKAEIISYLKAKLEAAKQVLSEAVASDTKQEDEENMVSVSDKKEAQKSLTLEAEAPIPGDSQNSNPQSVPTDNTLTKDAQNSNS